ncbi:MAG: serine--tRNA ligase [Armatimonadetes bacterium]|nr:serine--tRNA ligase [Armatimonadota bacterium]
MLDLKVIRQNPDLVRAGLRARGADPGQVDRILEADRRRRDLVQTIETLRSEQKRASAEIARLTGAEQQQRIAAARDLSDRLGAEETTLRRVEEDLDPLLRALPNLPHDSVPVGRGPSENVVVRTWGERAEWGFTPRDHVDLGARFGIVDLERGAKVAGSRFYYLLGDGALLEMALIRYALDAALVRGFVPVITPVLVKPEVITGAWGGARFDPQQTYHLPDDDLALIATSEQSLAGLYMDEILEEERLPVRLAGISWCFRREAGSYGRDVRGLYRVHQFDKVEMFSYCHPDRAWEEHEFLLSIEEAILQRLGIPYRVVALCTGDLGQSSAKTYDLEAWMPGRGDYGEVTSCSNTTDFQARRLGIRFRPRRGGSAEYVHTLNGTAIATSRALIAVLENYQQEDGSVRIPEVLVPFMGGRTTLGP